MDDAVRNAIRFADMSEAEALDMAPGRFDRAVGSGRAFGLIVPGRPPA